MLCLVRNRLITETGNLPNVVSPISLVLISDWNKISKISKKRREITCFTDD
jgi:hypothetical protein